MRSSSTSRTRGSARTNRVAPDSTNPVSRRMRRRGRRNGERAMSAPVFGVFAQTDAGPAIPTPHVAWHALTPMLILIGGAVVVLGLSAMSRRQPVRGVYALLTVITGLAAMGAAVPLWREV